MVNFQVAIDGPAGSGKSSISTIVAKKLGFTHIDTGAMYRAVTLEAINRGISFEDPNEYTFLNNISIIYSNNKTYLNGVDVSKEIRSEEVTRNVSIVSKQGCVRDKMVHFQRQSAKEGKILMDGRDIGTVVLPNADVKIFLTASAEERAKRRCKELREAGRNDSYEEVLELIKRRDDIDSNRKLAPLKQADDAIYLDTTKLTIAEVCNKIVDIINERLKKMENNEMNSFEYNDVHVKDKVTGKVVEVKKDSISIDLHQFTEGTMYLDHYTTDKNVTSFIGLVNVGDDITCEVTKVDEENGVILLSRLNMLKEENFKALSENTNEALTVKVTKKLEKGYNVAAKGFTFFMPFSQAPSDVKIGDSLKVKILELNERRKTGVVSYRVVEHEEYEANKNAELDTLNEGDVVNGTISKIEPFGAFVRFKYNQGLIRLNQVDHIFVKNINDVLHVGDKLDVKIISKENGKLLLSRKALLKTPFEQYIENHKVSDKVMAKVVNKMPYGLLLEVAPNVRGLLHKSEFSWNPNDNFDAYCKIGDEIEVAIIAIEPKKERISFSRKAIIDNPWSRVNANVGDLVEATVTKVDQKGVYVTALGVDAFIPAKDAFAENQNGKLDEVYQVGDKVNAVVSTIKPKEWILELSVKKHLANLERKEFQKYMDSEAEEDVSMNLGDLYKDILKK